MNANDAGEKIANAISSLIDVRDALGTQLSGLNKPREDMGQERRRLIDLYDRTARVVTAYHNGR